MLFIAILFISLFSIIYIFYNFFNKNFLNITNFKPKSNKFLLYLNILFLFLLSSLIYYKIGNPFINMDQLYSSQEKLIKKNIEQKKVIKRDLENFDKLVLLSDQNPKISKFKWLIIVYYKVRVQKIKLNPGTAFRFIRFGIFNNSCYFTII